MVRTILKDILATILLEVEPKAYRSLALTVVCGFLEDMAILLQAKALVKKIVKIFY